MTEVLAAAAAPAWPADRPLAAAGLAPWDAQPGALRQHAAFEPWPADEYQTVRILAHAPANNGVVWECVHLPTGERCVVKRMPNNYKKGEVMRATECGASSFLAKNRSDLLDLGRNLAASSRAYQDEECTYFVSELLSGGELFERVSTLGRFDEPSARKYAKQLLEGVAGLHASGIAHRDITLENLVCDAGGDVRIIDFGLAVPMTPGAERYSGAVGKPPYFAPEMYKGDYDVRPVDAWAVGICIYIMITGTQPWAEARRFDKHFKYFDAKGLEGYVTAMKFGGLFSRELLDLLTGLLRVNPKDRMTIDAARNHPWFQEATAR